MARNFTKKIKNGSKFQKRENKRWRQFAKKKVKDGAKFQNKNKTWPKI